MKYIRLLYLFNFNINLAYLFNFNINLAYLFNSNINFAYLFNFNTNLGYVFYFDIKLIFNKYNYFVYFNVILGKNNNYPLANEVAKGYSNATVCPSVRPSVTSL